MTEFEVIETKLAELYQLQRERIKNKMAMVIPVQIREEVAEAREILVEWLYCIEAKERANRRTVTAASAVDVTNRIFEARAKLD